LLRSELVSKCVMRCKHHDGQDGHCEGECLFHRCDLFASSPGPMKDSQSGHAAL
jgi:hypothetical protein